MYSQAHFETALQTTNLMSHNINANLAKIYQSGAFLADIGRLSWDSKYIESDSNSFSEMLSNICKDKDISAKLFSLGWKHHVFHDSNVHLLNDIFVSDGYSSGCCQIENYFQSLGSEMIFQGKQSFYIDCNLIRNAYQKLNDFSPTDNEIFLELHKIMIGVNLMCSLPNAKKALTENQIQILKTQINLLAETCVNDFLDLDLSDSFNECHYTLEKPESIVLEVTKNDKLSQKLDKFNRIAYFQKIGEYKTFDEIIYKITDYEKYKLLTHLLF